MGTTITRILLVEDDDANARCVRLCLERKGGYEVRVSADPQETLELTRQRWPNLILMDVSLAGAQLDGVAIDGLTLTRRILALPQATHLSVVLLTAHAMAGDRERMLELSGADDYVAKPIGDYPEFLARLRRVVERT